MINESANHTQSITYNLTVTSDCPTINRIEKLIDWINTIHVPSCLLLSTIDELKDGKVLLDIGKYLLKQNGFLEEVKQIRVVRTMKPVDLFNMVLKIIGKIDKTRNISIFQSNVNLIGKKEDLLLDLLEVLKSISETGTKRKVNHEVNEIYNDSITENTKEVHYTNCISIEDHQSQLNSCLKKELMKNLNKKKTIPSIKDNLVKLKNGKNMIIETFETKHLNNLKSDLNIKPDSIKPNDDNQSDQVSESNDSYRLEKNTNFSYHQKNKQRIKYINDMNKQKKGFSYENEKKTVDYNNNPNAHQIAYSTSFSLSPPTQGKMLFNNLINYNQPKAIRESNNDMNNLFGNMSSDIININNQAISYYKFSRPTDLIIDYDSNLLIKQKNDSYNYTIQLSQSQTQRQNMTGRQSQSQSRNNQDQSQSRTNTLSLNHNDSSLYPNLQPHKVATHKPPSLIKSFRISQKDTLGLKTGREYKNSSYDMRRWFIDNTDEEEPFQIDNTKTQIYIWLQNINLFLSKSSIPKIKDIPYRCTSGVLLCDLINQCEGKFEAIHGIVRKITKESQALVNIRKVLEHLRKKETFPSRNLWASNDIRNCNQKVIWELLEDIWRFYTNKLQKINSTNNLTLKTSRPKSQSTRASNTNIYSKFTNEQTESPYSLLSDQQDSKSNKKPIIKSDNQGINLHFHNYLIKESCRTSKASKPKVEDNHTIQIFNHFSLNNQCATTKINNNESKSLKNKNNLLNNGQRPKNYIMFEKISLKSLKKEIEEKETIILK